jgi:hypothetical protein
LITRTDASLGVKATEFPNTGMGASREDIKDLRFQGTSKPEPSFVTKRYIRFFFAIKIMHLRKNPCQVLGNWLIALINQ